MNKDHFYRGTFTTYILQYYIQCSALQWIVICVLPGGREGDTGEERGSEGKRERERSGLEGAGVVIASCILLLPFFFLTTVQFVLKKLNP